MPTHSETRFMPYSADQMFDLARDVARYPEFIPWVSAARIRSEARNGDITKLDADLIVAFKMFRERFRSDVTINHAERRIDTAYLDGPFKHLENYWIFQEAEHGCEVSYFVDFEFKSKILQAAIGLVFEEAMKRIVRSFEDRAAELYA